MNKRWRTGLLAIGTATAVILSLPGLAEAQGVSVNSFLNWNFLGGGARARGMGGAYLAVSDDGNAGSWNPAGLIYNEGVQVTLNYGSTRFNLDLDNAAWGLPKTPKSGEATVSNIPSAALVAPLTVMEQEFVLSVFYNRLQQGFTQSEFFADVDPFLGSPFRAQIGLNSNIATVGGAFGTAINDHLSIGGSISIVTGDGIEWYNLELDSLRFPDPKDEHNESVRWTTTSDVGYGGVAFKLGALYRTDRWSAAAIFEPGWTLTQNLDYRSRMITVSSGVTAILPKPDGIYAPLDGTDREIDIPLSIGVGGSYYITERLLVAADYQFRGFHNSSTSESDDGSSGFRTQSEPANPESDLEGLPVDWYSLHQIRLGAEYRHEASWGTVPLRLGVRNEPMLIGQDGAADIFFDQRLWYEETAEFPYFLPRTVWFQNGGQINAWVLGIGSGIHWSRVAFDVALEYSTFSYDEAGTLNMIYRCPDCNRDIDDDVSVPGEDEGEDPYGKRKTYRWGAYQRLYDASRLQLMVNFTGHF